MYMYGEQGLLSSGIKDSQGINLFAALIAEVAMYSFPYIAAENLSS